MPAPRRTINRARDLRKALSLPEVLLWSQLRGGGVGGTRFRRQRPLGPYILDFYAAGARLAVEIDGAAHAEPAQAAHDRRRDAWLAEQGVRVIRLPAALVLQDMAAALDMIAAALRG